VIPTQPDEVTASWMEAAMAAAAGSLTSMTVEPLPQGGLAGRLVRADLGWVDGLDLPRSVIVKLFPLGEEWRTDRALASMLLREVWFYQELGPMIGIDVPRVFHSAADEASVTTVLVMEDLSADVMYRPGTAPTSAVERIARCAARLHANNWGATGPEWLARFGAGTDATWAAAAAAEGARWISDREPGLAPLLLAWPDALAAGALAPAPRTIVHGDFGLRNVAFRDGNPIVFDWQQAGLADPGYDLLQLVNEAANGADPTTIAELVFGAYLDEWARVGAPTYGAAQLQADAAISVVLRAGTVVLRILTAPVRTRAHDEVLERWVALLVWWRNRYGLPDLA
jgi:hypothetical protein